MRVEERIDIARPVDVVWHFVADRSNDRRWCRKVKAVEERGERRWTVTHKPVPLRPPMELEVEHLTEEPPARLTMRQTDEASTFAVEYRLEPAAGGTRFTQVSDFEWKKLPRLLHKAFARGVRRDVHNQLRDLKRVLESD